MASNLSYTPIFRGEFPEDAESRWQAVRQFINHWSRPKDSPLPATDGGDSKLIATANAKLDGELSYSICQWLSLIENAALLDAPYIRDCPIVDAIETYFNDPNICDLTVILESGEQDVYWAVRNSLLQEDDPPVEIYQRYDGSISAFVGKNASVSEFALKYICLNNTHAVGADEWFSADGTDAEIRAVVEWFDYSLVFDTDDGLFSHFELLESDNIVAFVNGTRVEVSTFCDPALLGLPNFLQSRMEEHVKLRERFKDYYSPE